MRDIAQLRESEAAPQLAPPTQLRRERDRRRGVARLTKPRARWPWSRKRGRNIR
jgi:hypothetical protein